MNQKCLIDTTVILTIIFEKKKDLFMKLIEEYELFVPINVAEESSYKIILESCIEIFGHKNFFDLKKLLEKSDRERVDIIFKRLHVLNIFLNNVEILHLNRNIFDSAKVFMEKYRLLPNDAIIAATGEYYGIKKIATFDRDFKRVEFLEIVAL